MSDLIRRQDAIDAVFELSDKLSNEMLFIDAIVDEIENLPSAESEQEMKRQYKLEYPEIVHCNECIYSKSIDDKQDGYRCLNAMHAYRSTQWFGGDFCSYGEKR